MLQAGMFDEAFLYYEDVVCGYKLERNGMRLRFQPLARGQHLHQLKPSGVAAKGLFTGLWLYAFLEKIPDRAAKERFGVLSTDLRLDVLVRRLAGRALFRMIDNPFTVFCLEAMGAKGSKRGRITDSYYRLIFRRNVMEGLKRARREARRKSKRERVAWVDRGES